MRSLERISIFAVSSSAISAVPDVNRNAGPKRAGRNEPKHCLLAADDQRVAGVVAALKTDDALRAFRQPIDNLAFAFIAPLGTDDDDVLAHCGVRPSNGESGALAQCAYYRCALASTALSWRRYNVKPVAGRERPNALPMPS